MKSKGVTVRPIVMLDGAARSTRCGSRTSKVPCANRVGGENKGWTYAKYLSGTSAAASPRVGRNKRELARLKQSREQRRERAAAHGGARAFRDRIADVEIDADWRSRSLPARALQRRRDESSRGPESSAAQDPRLARSARTSPS
jgi:hypothetical protein